MKHTNFFTTIKRVIGVSMLSLFAVGVNAQVTVNATAGTPSGLYTDLTSAFAAINAGTHQGDIAIGIAASYTEPGTAVLNSSGAGSALYTSVYIAPSADAVVVSGATATGRGLIELNGADNVVIDGDNPLTGGINKNLTLQNTAISTTTYTSVVRIALSTLVTSANNVVVKNCNILGSATGRNISTATSTTGSEHTTFGILVGAGASTVATTTAPSAIASVSTVIATGATANNFVAQNNSIDAVARGIAVNSGAANVINVLTVMNNTIGNATFNNPTTVYSRGITVNGFTTAVISGNTVQNMDFWPGTACMGIAIGELNTTGLAALVEKNNVFNITNRATGTFGAYGINLAGGSNHSVRNNMVTNINHNMTGGAAFSTTFGVMGIRIASGLNHQIYHNSVNLNGTKLGTAATSLLSASLAITSTALTGIDVRDNLLSNTLTGGTTSIANVDLFLPSGATSAMNLTLNNNTYYCGTNAASDGILQVGATYSAANLYLPGNFVASATTPATNSRAYTSTLSAAGTNDNLGYASTNAAPFISMSDLHLSLVSSELINVEQKGVAGLTGMTTDIDGQTRPDGSTLLPDIGADEVTAPNVCSGTPTAGTISGTSPICQGLSSTLSLSGQSVSSGITLQWASSTTPGGPYTTLLGTGGTQSTGSLSATTYYVVNVTCTNSGITSTTPEFTVTVNPLPTITVTPSNTTYCNPGTGVTMTASGAVGYTWSPSGSLSSSTGATVTATPSSTTTYTVTGVDANGCINTATQSIVSAPAVTAVTATATPASTCDSTSVLTATATIAPQAYCQPTYANGTGFGDYISVVQLNTLDNTTAGAATPYYTLFPATGTTTTTLTAGNTYTVTLVAGTYTSNDVAAWIDFNQNGVLNDASEKLGETDNLGATPASTSFTFTVPLTALNGTTRFRVRDVDHGTANDMDPCAAQSSYGETEDYDITIVGGVDPYTVTWTPSTFLSSTTGSPVNVTGLTATTTYTATATAISGCSNSSNATVTLLPTSTSTTTQVSCGSFTWTDGNTYSTSGIYTQTLTNSVGCDSIATLDLTVNMPSSSNQSATACSSYTWSVDGTTYTASGTYSYTYVGGNSVGCDSTVVLDLIINQPTTATDVQTACDSYTWIDGNTYTASNNTATFTLTNAAGCDSIVTLDLTINNSTTGSETATACDSYTWATDGNTYTASGSYTATLVNAAGCDSIVTLNLTINSSTSGSETATACDTYTWATDGNTYTTSGTYTTTLVNAAGCDSIVTLNLTINTTPTATATDNGDATLTAGGTGTYQWIDCSTGSAIAGATAQTFAPTINGSYAVVVSNGTCSDTSACVVIDYIGIKESTLMSVSVFPNPTNNNVTVIFSATNASIEVLDAQGKLLQTVNAKSGDQISLANYQTGVYFIKVSSTNGSKLERVVKN